MGPEQESAPLPPESVVERRYRPLLPLVKVVDSDQPAHQSCGAGDDVSRREASRTGRCGITQCRNINCNLSSHRSYAAVKRHSKQPKQCSGDSDSVALYRPDLNDDLLGHSVERVQNLLVTSFPTGPPLKLEDTATFRELAHHYFGYQMDRLIQIFSPQLDRQKYKKTMIDHALSNDVFCLCIIANAKTELLMRRHIRSPDRSSDLVYRATARVLRQKLNDFKRTDIDWLLVLIVAMVGFDLAFNRQLSLRGHREALKQLASMKGGIHTIGHTLPYIVSTDRFIAIFTGQYPIFRQTPIIPVAWTASPLIETYGEALTRSSVTSVLDQAVVDFCTGQCHLICLIESCSISLESDGAPAPHVAVIPYFLYLRDRLYCEGTCLYAAYHENQTTAKSPDPDLSDGGPKSSVASPAGLSKSRCVLMAAMIIEYAVAHMNYYTIKGPYVAAQLLSTLEKQPNKEWGNNMDLLVWILFVLAAAVQSWDGHQQVIIRLKKALSSKHRGRFPYAGWQEEELRDVARFVWSNPTFDTQFWKVCHEIETLETS